MTHLPKRNAQQMAIFFLFILISISQADIVIKHLKKEIDLYHMDVKSKTKVWHRYVKKLFSVYFFVNDTKATLKYYYAKKKIALESLQMNEVYFGMILLTRQFMKKTKVECYNKNNCALEGRAQDDTLYPKFLPSHYFWFVTALAGRVYHDGYKRYLNFRLDPKLRINITFNEIYFFSIYNTSSYVLIHKFLTYYADHSCKRTHISIQSVFYGHFGSFNYFPKFTTFVILFCTEYSYDGETWIDLSFTLMSENFIQNIKSTKINENVIPLLSYTINTSMKIFAQSFSIKVIKLNRIVINIANIKNQNYIIFDGPGFNTKTLKIQNSIIKTSTFQCIIQVIDHLEIQRNTILEYYSIPIQNCITVTNVNFYLLVMPDTRCINSPIVINIHRNISHQTNITIVEWNYIHASNSSCIFGAMTFIEDNNREKTTMCNYFLTARSFYFTNSSVNVVIYWYENYKTISTILEVSWIVCKHIELNPCENISSKRFYLKQHLYFDIETFIKNYLNSSADCIIVQLVNLTDTKVTPLPCKLKFIDSKFSIRWIRYKPQHLDISKFIYQKAISRSYTNPSKTCLHDPLLTHMFRNTLYTIIFNPIKSIADIKISGMVRNRCIHSQTSIREKTARWLDILMGNIKNSSFKINMLAEGYFVDLPRISIESQIKNPRSSVLLLKLDYTGAHIKQQLNAMVNLSVYQSEILNSYKGKLLNQKSRPRNRTG